ncbi:GAF domain-containing sensor histidine kinase [Chloroflexota bacterium]
MDFHSLIPLIAAIVYISLFLVIIFNHPWQEQQRLFVMYLVAATLWSFSDFLMRSDFLMGYKLPLFRLVTFFTIWWALQLYYFHRSFLHLSKGWGIWFGYVSLVVFGILAAVGYAPPGITVSGGVVDPVYGWWLIPYVTPLLILTGMGVYSLTKRLKTMTNPRERNKIAYLIIAVALLAIFGFSGITPLAKGYPIAHVGALLSAGILGYAVMKHELVSINSVLRRGLGWVSLLVLGTGVYLLVFYFLNLLVGFKLEAVTLALATLSAAAMALLVYWLRPIFLEMVDQLFYRKTYSYRQALLSFSSKMGNIINLNALADEMLPTIVKALRTPQAKLLFEDIGSGDFTTQFAYPEVINKSQDEPRFNLDNPIVTWLKKATSPLDLKLIDSIPQFKGLWQAEKELLVASNLELLYPIKSRGKLIGILALGKKQPRAVYSQEDVEMVMSLASQAGIMIENARMLDSLKKQQLQMEQLLTKAIHAQEEERQRISVDLHDSVAQWLAGASYRAQTVDSLLSGNNSNEARGELATMESIIDKSLKELRRVLTGLRPPALDELGLNHALRQSLEESNTDGMDYRFSATGTPVRLPSSLEITVYRTVQEALTNIRKHANATKVNLRLKFQADKLLVEIRDNGKGFDLPRTLDSAISVGRMGLLGMKQRAEMLDGDIRIRTSEGAGTAIFLSFPIQSQI